MSGAAVKFRTVLPAGDTVTPADPDFVAIVPVAEPVSAGAPPIAPDLVRSLATEAAIRRVRTVSNHAVTAGLDNARAVTLSLAWTGLTRAEMELVRDFINEDCGGGIHGMDVDVDGSGSTATVLPRGGAEVRQTLPAVAGAAGGGGVWDVSVEVVHTV